MFEERIKFRWWGYLHTAGTIQAKRYFSELDIKEAKESPFVQRIIYPFFAEDREDAIEIIKEELKKLGYDYKS